MQALDGKLITHLADALEQYQAGKPAALIALITLIQDAKLARSILLEKGYGEDYQTLTQIARSAPTAWWQGNGSAQ